MNQNKITPAFSNENVPVVFSANDAFCPYMAVMIESVIENRSAEKNYDILILHSDVTESAQKQIKSLANGTDNVSIRFVDVTPYFRDVELFIDIADKRITKKAYYRLIIGEILDDSYEKAIYLDGDMVALVDVSSLMDLELGDNFLAAPYDVTGIAYCHNKGNGRIEYRAKMIEMSDPDDYFISGLLVLNLNKIRKEYPGNLLIELAASRDWLQHDQDVLNYICRDGKALLLHPAWNVLQDYGNNRYLPSPLKEMWLESERNPKIIHYGGSGKPWKKNVIRQVYFWKYAVNTTFFPVIVREMLKQEQRHPETTWEQLEKDIAFVQKEIICNHIKPTRESIFAALDKLADERFVALPKKPLISVVVPIYNVELFLNKCIESIINQTYENLEIILVDDGSTDRSGKLCEEWACNDSRIKVIHKNNEGVSSSRNTALSCVKGKFVYFIDSDDWIEIDTLEQLVMHMTGNVDVVVAGAIIEDEGGADADRLNSLKNYHSAKISGEFTIDDSLIDKITVTAWGKLFKNSIIQETGLTFFDGRKYEDNHFTIEYLIHAKNCFFVKKDFYHYVQRANSIMNSNYNYEDSLYIFDYLYKRLNKFNLLKDHKKIITIRYFVHLSMSYTKTKLINRANVLHLANQLAQDYNPDYFETDLVLHVKKGEYALEPLFDKDIFIVLNTQLSNISNAVNTVTSLLSQSYKTPKIWLILDCDTEMRNNFFPTEFSKYMGKNLFIKYTNDSKSSSIIEKLKTITDQIIITLETGISYPKNMLRCLMSAYLSNKAAFKVSSFNSVEEINKDALFKNFAILSFELNNTIVVYKSKNLIVSLTSYPARISSVALALKTIYEQTKLPDEIVLWLAKSQFINKFDDLPKELKELVSNNKLKVRWCDEDLKPHKKYFYAFKEYPDALIVTIDDDLLYHPNMIENLFLSFLLHPNAISATRAHLIPILPSGDILPYKAWPKEIDAFVNEPSMQLCATCGAGALHPTILFSKVKDLLDEETIKETCLYADDLWLKAIQLVANVPVVVSEEYRGLYYTPNSQDVALWHDNVDGGENDKQLLQIEEEIDQRYGKGTFRKKLLNTTIGENLVGAEALSNLIRYYKAKVKKRVNQVKQQYAKYSVLRMDIRNRGDEGSDVIEQAVTPQPLSVRKPQWLPDGITVESVAERMSVEVQCKGDGQLEIGLMGRDVRNEDGKRYPVWIDCTYFAVNGEVVFSDTKTVCHDKRYVYRRPVADGEIVKLEVGWSECRSSNVLDEYRQLQTELKNSNNKINQLQVELKSLNYKTDQLQKANAKTLKNLNETKRKDAKLDKELQNIKNGWSFKIGRVITWVPRKIRWLLK